jgi:predicted nucleic acid-binding protein
MTCLVDATFSIDLLNQQPYIEPLLPRLAGEGIALSIFVHTELWEGVYTSRDPKLAAIRLRAFLRGVPILPYTARLSHHAARMRGQLRAAKRPIHHRALDLLIAATALEHGFTMLTSDSDYDDIPGLTTFNPRTGQTVTH